MLSLLSIYEMLYYLRLRHNIISKSLDATYNLPNILKISLEKRETLHFKLKMNECL